MKKIFIFTEFIYVFPPLKMQMPQLIFKILDRKSPVWEFFTSQKNKLKAKCQPDISKLNEKRRIQKS